MSIPEQLLSILFKPIFIIPLIIGIVVLVINDIKYKNCTYYKATKIPYYSVRSNIGRYGEYLTYKHLKQFETLGAKFLFNLYIPKENGETTEIDVLMICSKGIFVFESKNYSGWIFGNEAQKNWYQTLPQGKGRSHKEQFYNPIMQNRSHIKHLKAFLGEEVPMRSIIVFSDRCTLKKVQIQSNDINVINRHSIAPVVSDICKRISADLLSESDITNLYNKLYPFTQVDNFTKAQHIEKIHSTTKAQSTQKNTATVISTTQTEEPIPTAATEQIKTDSVTPPRAETANEQQPIEPTDTKEQALKCPKCGGALVLRTATKGANAGNQFYGCSNYPKCRYIQNI